MPFCPQCRAEYRPGFKVCNTCDDLPLVETLEAASEGELIELTEADLADAGPVGFTQGGSGREVEVDGVMIDPARVFPLAVAAQIRAVLTRGKIASVLVPLDVLFADNVPRFEVLVKKETQDRAEALLVDLWREQFAEQGMPTADVEIDQCPACGSKVPLDQEECPECGLVVGTGAERASASAEE